MRVSIEKVVGWLCGRDTGLSSRTIVSVMCSAPNTWPSYPHDPADLGRCLRLLEEFPEWRPRLPEMASQGPVWAAMVERWDEMEQSMLEEVGIHWEKAQKAPKTYALMKEIEASAKPSPTAPHTER